MMHKSRTSILLGIAVLAGASAMAQSNSTVDVGFDKKTIYTDSLALPHSVNVGALLRLLPELLQRPTDFVLGNYDVKVDGVSMSEADDAVLSIVQLEDVEKIEVDNSPTSTDLNNGQSGSINICLRPMSAKPEGLSGSVSLGVASDFTLTPNVMVDYRAEKLSVRTMAFGEYFDTQRKERYQPKQLRLTDDEKFRQHLIRTTAQYAFDDRNHLSFTLTEATNHSDDLKEYLTSDGTGQNQNLHQEESGLFLMSELQYSHLLTHSRKLSLKAKYTHTPKVMDTSREDDGFCYHASSFGNNWQAEAALEDKLNLAQGRLALGYKVGVKGAVVNRHSFDTTTQTDEMTVMDEKNEYHVNSLMPLAELTLAYGQLSMKLGTEYQMNSDDTSNTWTGRLAMIWQATPANRLRLNLVRMPLDVDGVSESMGFDYIVGSQWGEHQLTASAGMNYCYDAGYTLNAHYVSTNLMGIYQYGKRFFCSLTGNIYSKHNGSDGYYNYYNLSLMPSIILTHGWRVATNVRFFSPIRTDETYSSPSTILQVNGGKSWGAWSIYAYARTPLTRWDRIEHHFDGSTRYYQMIPASIGCGVTWRGAL